MTAKENRLWELKLARVMLDGVAGWYLTAKEVAEKKQKIDNEIKQLTNN